MLSKIIKKALPKTLLTRTQYTFAQDWSHLYGGIIRFEDNTLGEDLLAVREQALNFAKTKLSPFAMEWEKNHTWPVEMFR